MRTLYFDIDGTLLVEDTHEVKPGLADGRFEVAVRGAGLDRIVCVGGFVTLMRMVARVADDYDPMGALFGYCGSAFRDEAWFRENVELARDPEHRAREIDRSSDWYWADDLAEHFCSFDGLEDVFASHNGGRILVPAPQGDGSDVLAWLGRIGV